ncbi:uncharacterized protein LOC134718526 [Mytilus trossulus]|uniref:uncharacterized protein LOC134718526 n=1 Tax=Mytilus trossulus TaxID=6551 RepID=UPI0030076164
MMDHRASISDFISQLTNFVSQHVPVVGSHFFPCYKCSIQPENFEEMKIWYHQQPINTFSCTQFDVSALYHALLHENRETRIECLVRMSETFLGELMQQCNAANSVQSRDMLQIALNILKDRIHYHNAMVMLSRDSFCCIGENPPVDGQGECWTSGCGRTLLLLERFEALLLRSQENPPPYEERSRLHL